MGRLVGRQTGEPAPTDGHLAFVVLAIALLGDIGFSAVEAIRLGPSGLDGSGSALGLWDLCKAVVIMAALAIAARRSREKVLAVIGAVFLALVVEDQIDLHHAVSQRLLSVLSGHLSEAASQFVVLTALAVAGFAAIWLWRSPTHPTARRARVVLSLLLGTLYWFAGGVDFLGKVLPGEFWPIVEEVGERFTITLSLAYSVWIASRGSVWDPS